MNALAAQDVELADEVIAFDDEIDTAVRIDIERKVERMLATQTPVACELRLVLAILHNNDPPRADGRPVRHHRQARRS